MARLQNLVVPGPADGVQHHGPVHAADHPDQSGAPAPGGGVGRGAYFDTAHTEAEDRALHRAMWAEASPELDPRRARAAQVRSEPGVEAALRPGEEERDSNTATLDTRPGSLLPHLRATWAAVADRWWYFHLGDPIFRASRTDAWYVCVPVSVYGNDFPTLPQDRSRLHVTLRYGAVYERRSDRHRAELRMTMYTHGLPRWLPGRLFHPGRHPSFRSMEIYDNTPFAGALRELAEMDSKTKRGSSGPFTATSRRTGESTTVPGCGEMIERAVLLRGRRWGWSS